MSYPLFVIGNPLLDIQVTSDAVLAKYGLKSDDAILAEAKHAPLYDEIVKDYPVNYVAGGAAQNTARGAAYVLPPNSVVYTGAVGDDSLAQQLKDANKREGLADVYLVKPGEKTGVCAVILTGHDRSLVTDLRVAEKFEQSHLSSPTVAPLIDAARVFYVEGYFLTHGTASIVELGAKAAAAGKVFSINFSAPFIPQFFKAQLDEVLTYADIVFGNGSEAEAYATSHGLPDPTNLAEVAKAIAALPKSNPSRPRVVIFTHGAKSTVLVSSDAPDAPKTFAVSVLKDSEIVDTSGAGDAFAGGFIGAYVAGKTVEESVETGHTLARQVVGQIGPQYKWPKVKIL